MQENVPPTTVPLEDRELKPATLYLTFTRTAWMADEPPRLSLGPLVEVSSLPDPLRLFGLEKMTVRTLSAKEPCVATWTGLRLAGGRIRLEPARRSTKGRRRKNPRSSA